jgi:hypothetical protein
MSKSRWLSGLSVGVGSVAAAGSALAQAQTTSTLYPSGIEVSAGVDGSFLSGPSINGFSTVIGGLGVAFRREIDPTISPQGWTPIGQASISFPLPAWNGARLKFSGQGGTVSSTFGQTEVLSAADYHNILYIDGSPTSGLPLAVGGNVNTTAASGNFSYALGSVSVEVPMPGPVWSGFASVEVGVAGMWSDTSWNILETGQSGMLRMTLNESATTWYGGPMVGFNFVKPVSEQVRFVSQSHFYMLVSSASLAANQTALQTGSGGFRNITVNGNFSNLTGRLETATGFEWNIGMGRLGAYGVGSMSETPSIVNPYTNSDPFASHGPVTLLNGLTWSAGAELRLTIPLN